MRHLPAAKCRGVLFLPSTSRAFTVSGVSNTFTLSISPFLQASNRLDPGSPPPRLEALGKETGDDIGEEMDELLILVPTTDDSRSHAQSWYAISSFYNNYAELHFCPRGLPICTMDVPDVSVGFSVACRQTFAPVTALQCVKLVDKSFFLCG